MMAVIKQLYHGSANIIEHPIFGRGKPYNYHGLGFYCTETLDMAQRMGGSTRSRRICQLL